MNYYTYCYLDIRKPGNYVYGDYLFDYEPFYVGKGKGDRSQQHLIENRGNNNNKHFRNKIKKIQRDTGKNPIVIIYGEKLNEKMAFNLENDMIVKIGRYDLGTGPLCNLTDGGEGSSNRYISDDTKNKISKSNTGKIAWNKGLTKYTDERVKNYAEKNIGHTVSLESKNKMSKKAIDRSSTIEYKEKFIDIMTSPDVINKRIMTVIENGSYKNEKNGRWINVDLDKICELYNNGYSIHKISKYINVSWKVIKKRINMLKEEGRIK